MNIDLLRAYLLSFPHVEETMQWGDNLVFWAGDKSIGAAGPERYAELLEIEGAFPAPYLARAFWIAVERYDVFSSNELKDLLRNAYELVFAKLPKRTKDVLALPAAERKKLIAARKKLLASQTKSR
jgi:hypothetical protein